MGRRVFEERKYNVDRRVLSYDDFKLFSDLEQGFTINEEQIPRIIKQAEEALAKDIPQLYAHEFMMFRRDGNRSIFESRYFPRRDMALKLALGEYIEKQGRFTDKLIDVLWLILEETTWVLPAHNPSKPGVDCCLPYAYQGEVDYIDLFAATTAATLSWIYYLCHDILDKVTTLVTDRMLFELDRRIIKPFMNDCHLWNKMWWSGIHNNSVNNWCPWIVSNILTVGALTVKDLTLRTMIVRRAMPMLDAFTQIYHPDGGCDEGPSYWGAAGAALFNACLVLYDMTNGYINVFDDPLIKNMGEYAVKVVVTPNRVLNFADSPSRVSPSPVMLYHWGQLCDSEMMTTYGQWKLNGDLPPASVDSSQPYRGMRFLTTPRLDKAQFIAPKNFYIGGLEVAGSREGNEIAKGLYVALKGGHNAESHNHNDVGNIIVFSDDKPLFIDAGSGRYTRRTFSGERYTIWAMCSDYHNCATFNGVTQKAGSQARSTDTVYDPETGKMTLNLATAYPAEANIASYTRSAELADSVITIVDDVALNDEGKVMFSYLVRVKPEEVGEGYFIIEGRKVSYDPNLEYEIEELDKTWPEVAGIPGGWDAEVLCRIKLTDKEPVKAKKYVMTVK